MSLEESKKFRDDFEKFMKRENVPVYLDSDDEMCLRRLTDCDVHEPGDLTADEAKQGVVGCAIQWVMTTITRIAQTGGTIFLRHSNGDMEEVDWIAMLGESIESSLEPNVEISLQKE